MFPLDAVAGTCSCLLLANLGGEFREQSFSVSSLGSNLITEKTLSELEKLQNPIVFGVKQ